jgi:hypothetical protein
MLEMRNTKASLEIWSIKIRKGGDHENLRSGSFGDFFSGGKVPDVSGGDRKSKNEKAHSGIGDQFYDQRQF